MTSILDPINNLVKGVESDITNVGHDAQAALDKATAITHQLAGSGVNHAGQVIGPLGDMFGHDPTEFALNAAKQTRHELNALLRRVAERSGRVQYTFKTPQGLRKVTATPPSNANPNQLALTMALAMIADPATMIEEAGRQAAGLPVKEKGLNGFTVFPPAMTARGLGVKERGVFGVDDLAIALLPVILPIIAAIAVQVLPGLIAAAASVIQGVVDPSSTPQAKAAAAAAQQQQQQQQTTMTVVVVAIVLLVTGTGIFFVVRHKKASA